MSLATRDKLINALETMLGIPFDRAYELAEFLDNYIVDEIRDEMTDHIVDMHDNTEQH